MLEQIFPGDSVFLLDLQALNQKVFRGLGDRDVIGKLKGLRFYCLNQRLKRPRGPRSAPKQNFVEHHPNASDIGLGCVGLAVQNLRACPSD